MARKATGQVVERDRKRGRVYALRFRAYGHRQFVTLGSSADGWTRQRAEHELANVLADVRRGLWRPPEAAPPPEPAADPTFREFASEWFATHEHEWRERTREDYRLSLTHHLLPFFHAHPLSRITAQEVERYKAEKVRDRELRRVERPLSNRTINKTLRRLEQILDAAVRYDLLATNVVRVKVAKLKEAEPKRKRMSSAQAQLVIACAMSRNRAHGVLLATTILAGGERASEITHVRWRDVDLSAGVLRIPESKTTAGLREVFLEPELVQLLREHKLASAWSQPDDFVFAGRFRDKPRDRNAMRTRVLYPAIREANAILTERGEALIPCDAEGRVTFHGLRFTYAGIRAELGEHPSITAKQMGHRDERMTLRVYTDVTGVRPKTRMAGLLGEWAPAGTNAPDAVSEGQSEGGATTAAIRS